jgi:hypothetical protein
VSIAQWSKCSSRTEPCWALGRETRATKLKQKIDPWPACSSHARRRTQGGGENLGCELAARTKSPVWTKKQRLKWTLGRATWDRNTIGHTDPEATDLSGKGNLHTGTARWTKSGEQIHRSVRLLAGRKTSREEKQKHIHWWRKRRRKKWSTTRQNRRQSKT